MAPAMRQERRGPRRYPVRRFPDLQDLPGLSADQREEHLGLYAGHVRAANDLDDGLRALAEGGGIGNQTWAELQRRRGFEYDGMRMHELYFEALRAGGSPLEREHVLVDALSRAFGTVAAWREEFVELGLMRGSGWAVLARDPTTDRLVNHRVELHEHGQLVGFRPILVLDAWEHAFLIDYRSAGKAKYVEAFLASVDWSVCAKRLE